MKKVLKIFLYFIMAVALLFIGLILAATLSNYSPAEQTTVYSSDEPDVVPIWTEMDLLTWNIGYCGLDSTMDFFYDGGEQVRPPQSHVVKSLDNVISFLKRNDTVEFFLIQEVDQKSKRSYHINEYDSIKTALPGYWSFFGKNYDVFFVPVPFSQPMGSVRSGIQILSKYRPETSVRWTFPGNYAWPKSLFMLDRCFLVNRYKLKGTKQLVLIDTHNSAYDDGSLRKMQMAYLKRFLLEEYKKGNYIIVGGDWNQSPPDFSPGFKEDVYDSQNASFVPDDYLPAGWTWAYDRSGPSNRRVDIPYKKGVTQTTVIDFYLLSPNVKLQSVQTIDLGFASSDHQPVRMKVLISN